MPGPRLGPMTVSDVLDGAFDVLKRAPATVLGYTAVFALPVQLLLSWFQRDLLGGDSIIDVIQANDTEALDRASSGGGTAAQLIGLMGPSLALMFIAAGLARLVGAWQVGRDLSIGDLLRLTLPRTPALLGAWLLVHLAEGVGFLLFAFPALVAMTWFLVTAPVIGAEGLGAVAAMRRSARLASRRFWPVLGLGILSGLVATLFGYAIGLLPTLLALLVGTDGAGWVLIAVANVLGSLLTMPVVAAATVLVYLDLRVRTEGLDLELEAAEVLPAR